jgi:hypothetical protein
VSLIVNNEEHLLRALAATGASSTIILEAYTSTSVLFIKTDDSNTTTWSEWVVSLRQLKLGYACDVFSPSVQPQETNFLGISCR